MARQLQPSVVYIGDAERTFVKKVPKTDKVVGFFVKFVNVFLLTKARATSSEVL